MVWPVVANPNARSPYGIGHVSWKPLTKVPCGKPPLLERPRIPR